LKWSEESRQVIRNEAAIDWRVEINTANQSIWRRLRHARMTEWESAVNRYMNGVGLHYGRLDFILRDDELFFLECNSNGQFGWLDDMESLALHREFLAAALDSASVVR
jgi:D-alanine-D-alanine ligase-like ATP-grasp enzyme